MMVDVQTETVVNQPIERVSAFAADPDNTTKWYANIKRIEWETEPPARAGTQLAFEAHFLGRKLVYTYEIAEFAPGERLVMHTAQGPFPMETTYTWAAISPTATRMTLRNRGNPSGFSRLFAPFMSMAMRRANSKDLAKLKKLLESN
ncbi:MAG: SRPBCC family protein [Anaerolineaceae bacterium]